MMKTIRVHKAGRLRGETPVEVLTIVCDQEMPEITGDNTVATLRSIFQNDGKALADAMFEHLPGGTIDELLAEMMTRRASMFRVSF